MDSRTRELQRAAHSGDHDASARLLRERVRAGELSLHSVRLGAFLGDRACRLVEYGSVPSWVTPAHVHTRTDLLGRAWERLPLERWVPVLLRRSRGLVGLGEREARCGGCLRPHTISIEDADKPINVLYHAGMASPHEHGCTGILVEPWPGTEWATLQASIAAAWVAMEGYACDCSDAIEGWGCPTCKNTGYAGQGAYEALGAIEAAEYYGEVGTLEVLEALEEHGQYEEWIPGPGSLRLQVPGIEAAALVVDEDTVREAISERILPRIPGLHGS